MFSARSFTVDTRGLGTQGLTDEVQRVVRESQVDRGLRMVFLHHTGASLVIRENANPITRGDLERFFA
jgi:thiamine phosphate synthase YjbQ (UPF0047 family)